MNKKVVELIDLMQPLATAETSEENSVEKSCFQRYWPKKVLWIHQGNVKLSLMKKEQHL
ncbi:hypothetical protein ACYRE2_02315 [Listeria seeligeri]